MTEAAVTAGDLGRWQVRSAVVGTAAVVLMVALADAAQALRSFLFAWLFFIGIVLGCFALLMLHHLVGGAWGKVIRRLLEAGTRTMPLMALLFLPLVLQLPKVYEWAAPEAAHDELLRHKTAYLNVPFFAARTAVYFAVWLALAWFLNRWSRDQERGDTGVKGKLQSLSAPGLLLYGLTVTFASVDWAMSLEPHWFSTIYGVMFMVGQALATLAFVLVVLLALARRRPLAGVLAPSHYHDLGTLMFAFVMLWAYIAFSQFLIIWSGNLPEETPWYIRRLNHGWGAIAGVLVVFHFALPFLLLLSRPLKKKIGLLGAVAAGMLVMRLVDTYWMIAPSFHEGELHVAASDVLAPLGVGGLWLAFFLWQLKQRPLEPVEAIE
jgi:hypothetical protein